MKKIISFLAVAAILISMAAIPTFAAAYNTPRASNLAYSTTLSADDIDALVTERADYLDYLVARGRITQELADSSLETYRLALENRTENNGGYCDDLAGGSGRCGMYSNY